MVDVSRTLTVRAPLASVVEYLKDFAHAESWDPGTVSCVQTTPGPVGVGTEWRNVSEFRGKETTLTYRLEKLEPQRLVFVGENKTATSTDDLRSPPSRTARRSPTTRTSSSTAWPSWPTPS